MVSIIIAIVIFCVLVVFHEFGHFIMAKKNGIYVVEFSIGMGPRLLSFKKGETRYSLKLLPIGGSCMMLGEDEDIDSVYYDDIVGKEDENATDAEKEERKARIARLKTRTFNAKSVWARISVVLAGPVFNFLLAFILSIIVIGSVGADPSYVTAVEKGSPAEAAGLKPGDIITEYNGDSISIGREIYIEQYINPPAADNDISISYNRDGKTYKTTLTPKLVEQYMLGIEYYGEDTAAQIRDITSGSAAEAAGLKIGDIILEINSTSIDSGVALDQYLAAHSLGEEAISIRYERDGIQYETELTPAKISYVSTGFTYNLAREKQSFADVIKYSAIEVKYEIVTVVKSLKCLVTGRVSADEVSGPVGIVNAISNTYEQSREDGIWYTILNMLNISIMLSANLGVMNLLPIPALDGGRLVFLIIEVFRKKAIPQEKEAIVHLVGMAVLMLLMVFLLFNDISKLL
ncbi:MAG: RIP metalloprotease RseP [Eubacterium sp.]